MVRALDVMCVIGPCVSGTRMYLYDMFVIGHLHVMFTILPCL